jgi:hypothetical protein
MWRLGDSAVTGSAQSHAKQGEPVVVASAEARKANGLPPDAARAGRFLSPLADWPARAGLGRGEGLGDARGRTYPVALLLTQIHFLGLAQ